MAVLCIKMLFNVVVFNLALQSVLFFSQLKRIIHSQHYCDKWSKLLSLQMPEASKKITTLCQFTYPLQVLASLASSTVLAQLGTMALGITASK
jgi:hypothetical protein